MDIVAYMLPRLRGYVTNKYRWIADRGHCLLTVEDLIQVASIAMLKLEQEWIEICDRDDIAPSNMAAFMGYLKPRVKAVVLRYSASVTDDQRAYVYPSLDETTEAGEIASGDARTSVRVPERFGEHIAWDDIVDHLSLMSRREKIRIALRYFDTLPWEQINQILGGDPASSVSRTINRLREFARAQYVTEYVDLEPVSPRPWEPPETLHAYLRDRHGMDLDEYLGYFTLCLRADVSYLVDILGSRHVFGETSNSFANENLAIRNAIIDQRLDEGRTHREIAEEVGCTRSNISYYVAKRRRAA